MNLLFSGRQLSAMTKLALYASGSDGEFEAREIALITAHIRLYVQDDIKTMALIDVARSISYAEAVDVAREMSMNQKRHLCAFIGSVIGADGNITNSELEFWSELSYAADLPIMTIEEAINIFRNNMGVD